MNIRKKTFGRVTLTYGLGYLFVRGVSFLLLPLYTNLLSPTETGFIFLFLILLAFFNTFYNHGMDSALLKFYNNDTSKEIITTSLCYSFIFGLLISFIIVIIKKPVLGLFDQTTLGPNVIYYFVIILFFDMMVSRTKNIIRLLEKPYYYLFISLFNVLSSLILNVYFIKILQMGIEGALISLVFVSSIQFVLVLPIIIKFFNFSFLNKKILNEMLSFALPFFPAAIFFIIIEMSDRWMIHWLRNIQEVGLYGSGYKVGSIILMMVLAFNLNWQPFYLKKKDKPPILQFENIGNLFISVLLMTTWIISFLGPFVLSFNWSENGWFSIIGKEFWPGLIIVPAVCLAYVFYGIFIVQMPPIYLKNKQNWIPFFWGIGALTNILLNYFLIQNLGFIGASMATLLTYIVMVNLIIYKNKTWMPIKINYIYFIPCSILVFITAQYNLYSWFVSFSLELNLTFILLNFICCLLNVANISHMYKKYNEQ